MNRIVRIGQTTSGIVRVRGTLTCMGAMLLAVVGVAGVGTHVDKETLRCKEDGNNRESSHVGRNRHIYLQGVEMMKHDSVTSQERESL